MLSVERVRLGVKLLPLLHKRVEVDTAELTRPELRLMVDAQGHDKRRAIAKFLDLLDRVDHLSALGINGVQLLPMTAGCIVLTYNLKGVTGLKLSRSAYAGIFLGKVKKWNDPLIKKDNAGLALPDSVALSGRKFAL